MAHMCTAAFYGKPRVALRASFCQAWISTNLTRKYQVLPSPLVMSQDNKSFVSSPPRTVDSLRDTQRYCVHYVTLLCQGTPPGQGHIHLSLVLHKHSGYLNHGPHVLLSNGPALLLICPSTPQEASVGSSCPCVLYPQIQPTMDQKYSGNKNFICAKQVRNISLVTFP